MDANTFVAATVAAQRIMKAEAPGLVIDGKWGNYTQSVYDKLSPDAKSRVDAAVAVETKGGVPADLFNYRNKQRAASTKPSVTQQQGVAQAAVRAAALEFNIPEATLMRFAKIESNFNAQAVNGSSRGLMQMQPGAWRDAAKITSLKPYSSHVFDPVENARAGAAYLIFNRQVLNRLGYSGPWDASHMYLAHQQGAGGLLAMYAAANGKPTKLSAENMRRNPPQDGIGVTLDPVQFYRRWVAVVEKK